MIWLADGNFARPVRVRLGVTDGINTEVIADELKEGANVIVGEAVAGAGGADEARNPFAPQFRGGRRGGGR
jgi:HlyD family secretion protein